jgi:hypothetical protein
MAESLGENVACLRGFEPPTFGSGVPYPTLLDIWGKPHFQRKTTFDFLKRLVFLYALLVRIRRVYSLFVTWRENGALSD